MVQRVPWALAVLAGAMLTAGCGGPDRPATVPVTGKVTYRGQPVLKAMVVFVPESGRPATGMTDESGRFRLSTFEAGDGARPGPHTVTIHPYAGDDVQEMPTPGEPLRPRTASSPIPARYADAQTSELGVAVDVNGENDFQFHLTD